MDIFLSWSGTKSKKIAKILKDWLPTILQALKPFYSSEDIAKGTRWSPELAQKLSDNNYGIIIMTDENTTAPWILFEAGALSKNMENGRVCTFLTNVKETDLMGPLGQFQNTKFEKEDIKKLIYNLNELLGETKLNKEVVDKIFEKMYLDLETEIKAVLEEDNTSKNQKDIRSKREILEEILRHTRSLEFKHVFRSRQLDLDIFNRNPSGASVTYDEESESIIFKTDNHENYWIEKDRLYSTGEILDYILQINSKGWCTPVHLKSFLDCLEEMSEMFLGTNAQGSMCPGGEHMKLNWSKKSYMNYSKWLEEKQKEKKSEE